MEGGLTVTNLIRVHTASSPCINKFGLECYKALGGDLAGSRADWCLLLLYYFLLSTAKGEGLTPVVSRRQALQGSCTLLHTRGTMRKLKDLVTTVRYLKHTG